MISAEDQGFLEAIFTVATRAMDSGHPVEDFISHPGVTLCAAEALRLVTTGCPPDKVRAELGELGGMCRVVAQVGEQTGQTAHQRMLRLITVSYQIHRKISDAFAAAG